MTPLLSDWLMKRVHLVLSSNVSAMDGTLVLADSTGVMIELLKGQSTLQKFIPWTSILHLDLLP